MNKVLLLLGAASLLAACTKSESEDSNPGDSPTLSTISIADAKIIYKRTPLSRAGGSDDEGYWKINHQGQESKILIYDQYGNPTDTEIDYIEKLNENLLLIKPTSNIRLVADRKTGRLYLAPDILNGPVKEGPDGMLYFIAVLGDGYTLCKLDPENFSIQKVLPDGQYCENFFFNKHNSIYYFVGPINAAKGKILTPGGRIYPQNGNNIIFPLKGEFYSLSSQSSQQEETMTTTLHFSKWEQVSDNELEEKAVINLDLQYPLEQCNIVQNAKTGNVLITGSINELNAIWLYEFDGSQIVKEAEYENNVNIRELFMNLNNEMKSLDNDYFLFPDLRSPRVESILKFSIDDYSITSIPYESVDGYEIYDTVLDEANNRLLFTALRYDDGKIVIGELSAEGHISIINKKESDCQIINLIPLY